MLTCDGGEQKGLFADVVQAAAIETSADMPGPEQDLRRLVLGVKHSGKAKL